MWAICEKRAGGHPRLIQTVAALVMFCEQSRPNNVDPISIDIAL